jgi:hypothetical protein
MSRKTTPAGVAGNAKRYEGIPLRQHSSLSYDVTTGRASSSICADQDGRSPVGSKVGTNLSRQYTDAFDAIDKRRAQNATPVRDRPFTSKVDG